MGQGMRRRAGAPMNHLAMAGKAEAKPKQGTLFGSHEGGRQANRDPAVRVGAMRMIKDINT